MKWENDVNIRELKSGEEESKIQWKTLGNQKITKRVCLCVCVCVYVCVCVCNRESEKEIAKLYLQEI